MTVPTETLATWKRLYKHGDYTKIATIYITRNKLSQYDNKQKLAR